MERRVLLAISLSFLVLVIYQSLLPPPPLPSANTSAPVIPGAIPTAQSVGGRAGGPPPSGHSPLSPGNATPPATSAVATPAPVTDVGEASERQITVETRTVSATFTNRGARLLHWRLKGFLDDKGKPLDLIPEPDAFGPGVPTPFSLRVDDPDLTRRLNEGLYRADASGAIVVESGDRQVSLDLQGSDGLRATKTFTFRADGYIVSLAVQVEAGGQALNYSIDWGPGLGNDIARAKPSSFFSPNYSTPAQAIVYRDGSVVRLSQTEAGSETGRFAYAGVDDHYFAALLLNGIGSGQGGSRAPAEPLRLDYVPVAVPNPVVPGAQAHYQAFSVRFESIQPRVEVFFGPKAFDDLRAVDVTLVESINFGMFRVLAVPLLGALKKVHAYVGNWGWAIVVLTILINLAMFPLRHRSVVSMRKMQELQPQMKAIQDRYAKYKITDPERQKMNEEVMGLYKAKGVNPASGCFPMLLTFPFLFAFFAMLSQAIEIRGAPFLGWIPDLSRPDPLYIWPILMGITMVWQQKLTPAAMDPVQQKMMMFMPVMFTFMMLVSPSGLVIYWFIGNVWAIGQQYVTNYLIGPPKVVKKA